MLSDCSVILIGKIQVALYDVSTTYLFHFLNLRMSTFTLLVLCARREFFSLWLAQYTVREVTR